MTSGTGTAASSASIRTAQSLARAGRSDEAELRLRRIWASDPTCIAAGAALAEAHIRNGNPKDAIDVTAALRELDPTDYRVMDVERELGILLFSMNLWEDAHPFLETARQREPWDQRLGFSADRSALPDYLVPSRRDRLANRTLIRYGAREAGRYIFTIDVVGTCNLRCPTCPVGNSELGERTIGFMDIEMFEAILEKILSETAGSVPQLNLFNWGEPLLHPKLPEMIRMARAAGLPVHLSSNLNITRGLKEVIEANSDDLKISISGFSPRTYERAHKRGDIELVKGNMKRIREYLDESGASTRVWVGQHIYRSNQAEAAETEAFARGLGFEYAPILAYFMPVERVVDQIEGPKVSNDGILSDLLTPPQDRSGLPSGPDPELDCELRFNQTVINHDGSVALCCSVYDGGNMLGVNFLEKPLAEIEDGKYSHSFCSRCRHYGLQYAPPRGIETRRDNRPIPSMTIETNE